MRYGIGKNLLYTSSILLGVWHKLNMITRSLASLRIEVLPRCSSAMNQGRPRRDGFITRPRGACTSHVMQSLRKTKPRHGTRRTSVKENRSPWSMCLQAAQVRASMTHG
jgi:hypothetical protein